MTNNKCVVCNRPAMIFFESNYYCKEHGKVRIWDAGISNMIDSKKKRISRNKSAIIYFEGKYYSKRSKET